MREPGRSIALRPDDGGSRVVVYPEQIRKARSTHYVIDCDRRIIRINNRGHGHEISNSYKREGITFDFEKGTVRIRPGTPKCSF